MGQPIFCCMELSFIYVSGKSVQQNRSNWRLGRAKLTDR